MCVLYGVLVIAARMFVLQTETAVLEVSAKQLKVLRQDLATETSTFRVQLQRRQASTQEV